MKSITLLLFSFLCLATNDLRAQNGTPDDTTKVQVVPPPPPAEEVFDVVEDEPTYPGGEEAMIAFIKENVIYPEEAITNNEEGKVYVRFVIEKDGSVTNVKVVRGVSPSLDAEAIRLVASMPKWNPGLHRGKPVRTNVVMPIVFKLSVD